MNCTAIRFAERGISQSTQGELSYNATQLKFRKVESDPYEIF